jgi:hypothetical protein
MPFDCFQMAYGMTEIGLVFISMPEDSFEEAADTVGYLADHVEVSDGVAYEAKR